MVGISFIKIDRKLKDWEWKTDPCMVALWIHLLLEANYKENTWKGQELPKGTFPTSVKSLAEKTGLSIQQTRRCLSNLQTTSEITIKATNKYSLITINKWEEYQCNDEKPTSKRTNKNVENQQTNNKQTNNTIRSIRNKEEKNINNIRSLAVCSDDQTAYAKFPTNQNDIFYFVSKEDVEHYKELYPAVDVEQQIRSMQGWLESNKRNRKTYGGMPKFITNWLNKEQNQARAYSQQTKKGDDIFYHDQS